jgi:FkbM family methyltransferase
VRSATPGASSVSFEPLATSYERLRENTKGDPQWTVRNLALGSEPGEATIHVASNDNSSSLLPMLDAHRAAAPSIDYVAEQTVTVAAEEARSAQHPFLKIDTQGFEREVLAGGKETVERCVGLQLELSFVQLYDGGMLVDEAIRWAYEQGFHLVGIEQGYAAPGGEILQVDGVFVRS